MLMHMPKTGGTAITEALKKCLTPRRVLSPVYDGVLFGSFTRFQEMSRELRELIYVDSQGIPSGADFVADTYLYRASAESMPKVNLLLFCGSQFPD